MLSRSLSFACGWKMYTDKSWQFIEGKIHDHLVMDLDYTEIGPVKVSMNKYVNKVIMVFPEEIGIPAVSPAAGCLFQVKEKEGPKSLPEKQFQDFLHVVAQLLFLSTRAWKDIQTDVSSLTTRVKSRGEDDWGELKRFLKYFKCTKYMKLDFSIDTFSIIKWWVDVSDRTHLDCKGRTGTMMSLGKGNVSIYSNKKKLNTKSSTEIKLVGAYDFLPHVLWSLYFIESQGYPVDQNILYQDHKATLRLEGNEDFPRSKRTNHIKAKFFFIKDKAK